MLKLPTKSNLRLYKERHSHKMWTKLKRPLMVHPWEQTSLRKNVNKRAKRFCHMFHIPDLLFRR